VVKLATAGTYLFSLLGKETPELVELMRGVTEGTKKPETRADLIASTKLGAALAYDPEILRSRPGPKGSLDADPARVALLTLAAMVNGNRREVALKAWAAWNLRAEGSKYQGGGTNWTPTIMRCALTGKHIFGDAVAALIGDPKLAKRVRELRVGDDGRAEIAYDNGQVSRFEIERPPENMLHHVAVLDGGAIAAVANLLKPKASDDA